ncbi:hypothetical protein BC332_02241 [Capsicum chinense]|nr:hypothetical protein BC332_02241 [Capsicum chinense]
MIAFLGVADAFEEGDAKVKVWVRQVRDVTNDIEDVINESMLLSYDHYIHGSCCFIAKLFFSIRNIKSRHKLVFEIQAIKARVHHIAVGHQRYRYKYYVPEQGSSSNQAYDTTNDRRGDALLLEEIELVGIENPRQQLIGWIVEDDPRLKVVSVVGMGGSGKTTLVKKVYEDATAKKNFNSLAWITVSTSFKVEEVLKDMIQQLYDEVKQPAPEGLSTMSSNRYALPHVNNESRVILTIRLLDVAFFCRIETNGYVYENDDGSMKLGQIHDLYHELILSKSRNDNFTATVDEQNKLWPEKTRRLSLHGMLGNLQVKGSVTKLRSLLTFGVADPQSFSCISQVLGSARMLRVLDLIGAPLKMIPETVFKLFHLRYLSLRNTNVKALPRSIERLKQLEIVDLKQTYITELPVEILKLENLRHLLVYSHVSYSYLPYNCSPGFKAFGEIGALRALQKLVYIEATPSSGILSEVGMLSKLRRLCIMKLRKEDGRTLCSSIEKLRKFESLNLKSLEENEILDLSYMLLPPPFLQRLYLTGHIVKLPKWIQDLNSLVKIYFRLEGLRQITIGEGVVPHLEKMVIQRCAFLESVPNGIECLLNLKVLEFFDIPDEFITTLHPDK